LNIEKQIGEYPLLMLNATQKNNLSIVKKPYEKGDEKHIIALFEKVFGKTMGKTESEQHWRWEILGNPVKPVSTMLAWHGQRLIAQYAVNPIEFWIQGKEFTAALSLDTMTDGDYGGKGIFQQTAKLLYSEITERGISFIYGFPNSKSVRGFLKYLDWQIIVPPPILIRPLDIGPLVKNKTKSARLGILASKISKPVLGTMHRFMSDNSNISIRKENSFDVWADELWQKCRDQHKLWIVRDYKYLSWRYDIRPESQYSLFTAWLHDKIMGYIITTSQNRNEGRVSFILDIVAVMDVNGVVEKLLNAVINMCIENNDALISAMVMPASVYRKAFNKFFFIPLPKRLFPQEINFGGRLLNNKISKELFYNPASWYISWGDTDLL